jgi:acyl transferase domain-containing protein
MAHELAIIGLDCRFPGSKDVEEYWDNLKNGVDCVSIPDTATLTARGVDPDYVRSPNFVGAAYEIADIDKFDAAFFGITTLQAMVMSPQHRLLLESAWGACEHAGYNPAGFKDDVGVFVGSDDNTYYLGLQNNPRVAQIGAQRLVTQGNYLAYLPAWISYKLNLHGPSLGIHAGCSSSLAAVHLACNSLLLGECKVAIAGAVAARVPQRGFYHYEAGGIESADGRCRPFDAAGTGTVYGNGVGTVVIKRLADALAERDTVHAIIKGSALNNDGSGKLSFAAPNAESWAAVITEALINSGVRPESIGYLEAHGTGTPTGDAIEIEALTKAFRQSTNRKGFCAVGSVKANIGHLEAAAGIAGLIKVICILENGLIPPAVHFCTPNERIDFANSPFLVSREPRRWPASGMPRRAAINSFGIGGGNAHLILEEAPAVAPSPVTEEASHILFISARSAAALETAVSNLLEYLQRNPTVRIEDVAYTLALGRESFAHRYVVGCRSTAEAIAALEVAQPSLGPAPPDDAVFVLAEPTARTLDLCRDLYAAYPGLKHTIDSCTDRIRSRQGIEVDFRNVFFVQYALTTLLMSMGVKPAAIIAKGRWMTAAEVTDPDCWVLLGEMPDSSTLQAQLRRQGRHLVEVGLDDAVSSGDRSSPMRVRQIILAHLWQHGIEIRKEQIYPGAVGRRIPLPTYPFERKAYWIDRERMEPSVVQAEGEDLPATERSLTEICRELLSIPTIDPRESLFDLGASSLQITQLKTRIREYLGVDLPLQTMFDHPSVRGLTAQIDLAEQRAQ